MSEQPDPIVEFFKSLMPVGEQGDPYCTCWIFFQDRGSECRGDDPEDCNW